MSATIDITPSPRILRTLGQIPFAPWQCIAELIDNSLDGFRHADVNKISLQQRRVIISWSVNAPSADRVIEVNDTGPGMTPEVLNECVRAGYSMNDPIDNLGLFGMGFNIATARLGDKTVILSATPSAPEWTGIEIDFAVLTKNKTFNAPLINTRKSSSESGTRIIISGLDANIYNQLNPTLIRRQLEEIYTPILSEMNVEITLQGKVLSPRPHCIWARSRYVLHGGNNVPAVIDIDETLGNALYDSSRNRYLTTGEEEAILKRRDGKDQLPEEIILRPKRVYGWIGIQRYSDPDDFGIDFIRNGRKILLRDKSLFSFYNPISCRSELEYPVELGSTVGGRIVGEIHIDHIPPTYQKNDFHRADISWNEMITVLRGDGPILPKRRKAMGYTDENQSPLGRLISAYRRSDTGTRNLAIPSHMAREWYKRFRDKDPEYLSDEKWWEAAKEEDRLQADSGAGMAPPVDSGTAASDDIKSYIDDISGVSAGGVAPASPQPATQTPPPQQSQNSKESLLARSVKSGQYSREYNYQGGAAGFNVNVWELKSGIIGENDPGDPGYNCL